MKVLVVVDNNAQKPVIYANKVDTELKTEVKAAANACAIAVSDMDVAIICNQLTNSMYSWKRNFCFDLIDVN